MSGKRGQRRTAPKTRHNVPELITPPPSRYDDDPCVLFDEAQQRGTRASTRLKKAKVSLSLNCNNYVSPSLKGKNVKGKANTTVIPTEDAEATNASAHPATNDNTSSMDFEPLRPDSTKIPSGLEAMNSPTAAVATELETEVRLES
jgi:hypothetical protein